MALLAFYLRSPVISSRYLLDLMPCIAAGLLAGWLGWGAFWRSRGRAGAVLSISTAALAAWLIMELARGQCAYGTPRPQRWAEVAGRLGLRSAASLDPEFNSCPSPEAALAAGIPYNGAGWEDAATPVRPCLIFFARDPQWLELQLAPEPGAATGAEPLEWRA